MPKGKEIVLDFLPDGTVHCSWWTKQLQALMDMMKFKDAPNYEHVNLNPWCG